MKKIIIEKHDIGLDESNYILLRGANLSNRLIKDLKNSGTIIIYNDIEIDSYKKLSKMIPYLEISELQKKRKDVKKYIERIVNMKKVSYEKIDAVKCGEDKNGANLYDINGEEMSLAMILDTIFSYGWSFVRDGNEFNNKSEYYAYEKRIEYKNIFSELDKIIGLGAVKEKIQKLSNFIQVKKLRESKGLKGQDVSLHLVFTGNPGTGKTTVARLIGKIYKELGVLDRGHVIEVDRTDLVAEYIGQTAIKTKQRIDEAQGGILFIDEAYTLTNESKQDFGIEAINTILKEMEDKREKFIVIVAGYKDEMKNFIGVNPGLESRFNNYIVFEDYSLEELVLIFKELCKANDYRLDDKVEELLLKEFEVEIQKDNFSNARYVRNMFEKAIMNHSTRIVELHDITSELDILRCHDIQCS